MTMSDMEGDSAKPAVSEAGKATTSKLTLLDPLTLERLAREEFAMHHSLPLYRDPLTQLLQTWHRCNEEFFDGRLKVPHCGIGATPPRAFVQCRRATNYGSPMEIVVSDRIAFGISTRIVIEPWPSSGLVRLLDDLVLHGITKQSVMEVGDTDEDAHAGYGPLFVTHAARISPLIGLPDITVRSRRRGSRGLGEPVAATWPWAFRPDGYYLGHVNLMPVAVHPGRAQLQSVIPGVYEYLLWLATTNRHERLIEVLGRQVDAELETRVPTLAGFEARPQDASGMPLPEPSIDQNWLAWNGGCVRAMAEAILTRRMFDGMPMLADALQDAGCEDTALLNHCRANTQHTARCWALKALLGGSLPE